jgi:hypothetical protein
MVRNTRNHEQPEAVAALPNLRFCVNGTAQAAILAEAAA